LRLEAKASLTHLRDVKVIHIQPPPKEAPRMSSTESYPPAGYRPATERPSVLSQVVSGLRRGVEFLDERGRGAWWAVAILSFFVAPPLGVALLLFMLGTGRMFGHRHHNSDRAVPCGWGRHSKMRGAMEDRMRSARTAMRPSGNAVFDSYKADTLRRLEEEQRAFEEFLGRLREAKDKAEFDQFMDERARRAADRTPPEDGEQAA
jgi:hypothetical protein